jgi:hypothetical protein
MTTPNSKTNGAVTLFEWTKFPLEEDEFSICLVKSGKEAGKDVGKDVGKDFENLCEYIKMVFPENLIMYDSDQSYSHRDEETKRHGRGDEARMKRETRVNTTIFCECYPNNPNTANNYPKWLNEGLLFQEYRHHRHLIVVGEIDNIPQTVFSNSRIIIFESGDDLNRYLQKNHSASLTNFETTRCFMVVDKSVMGHFNIYSLPKKDLVRYAKEHRNKI